MLSCPQSPERDFPSQICVLKPPRPFLSPSSFTQSFPDLWRVMEPSAQHLEMRSGYEDDPREKRGRKITPVKEWVECGKPESLDLLLSDSSHSASHWIHCLICFSFLVCDFVGTNRDFFLLSFWKTCQRVHRKLIWQSFNGICKRMRNLKGRRNTLAIKITRYVL